MDQQAHLKSIDTVPMLATALVNFAEEAKAALVSLDLEVSRTKDWVQRGQRNYWGEEIRRGRVRQAEAQAAFDLAQTMQRTDEREPTCWEERKRLEAAKRRLRRAEEKLELVAHWAREVEHEVIEFRGGMAPLSNWLESEFPQAMASLERMERALESYIGLASPGAEPPPPPPAVPAFSPAEPAAEAAAVPEPDAHEKKSDA